MKNLVAAVAFTVLALGTGWAQDDEDKHITHSSLEGPTGLLFNPTAYSMGARSFVLTGSWYQDRPLTIANNIAVAAAYGFANRLEGGVIYNRRQDGIRTDDGGAFLKFVLNEEGGREPAFAIGGRVSAGNQQALSFYAVISRQLTPNLARRNRINGHLGVRYDRLENYPVAGPRQGGVRPYAGVDLHFNPRTSVLAEVRSRQPYENKTFISAGLQHAFSGDRIALTAGVTNAGLSNGIRPLIMVNIRGGIPKK